MSGVNVSALDFLVFAAYFVIFKILVLAISSHAPDSALGRAIATIA